MKEQADKKRRALEFQMGDMVYLRIHPYKLKILSKKSNEKLSPRFYGPYKVIEQIGKVAYKLQLPESARIHLVFHVSQLKRSLNSLVQAEPLPDFLSEEYELQVEPEKVKRVCKMTDGKLQVLIKWKGLSECDSTWKDYETILLQFPTFHLEDKVQLAGGENNGPVGPLKYTYRNTIWRWPTNEKIKFFLWKMAWNRLPLNCLSDHGQDTISAFGGNQQDSIMHIIRDCPEAKKVWLKLVNPNLTNVFFSSSMQDWILWNAKNKAGSPASRRLSWQRIFAQACWWIWKNRCTKVFSPDQHSDIDIAFLSTQIVLDDMKLENLRGKLGISLLESKAHWTPPEKDWIRLDIDGSVNSLGEATCGGVIRDDLGSWKWGFGKKLGYLPSTTAELLGIHEGLSLCWSLGYKKIKLFTDSMEALNSISFISNRHHPLFNIVDEIRSLLMRDWKVSYEHVYREAICCADRLAHLAHNMDWEFYLFQDPPEECYPFILQDLSGGFTAATS